MEMSFYFDNYADRAFREGNAFLEAGNLEKAIECYNYSLALDKYFTSAVFYKGIALARQKRFNEAISCFDSLLELFPDDLETLENKGSALIAIDKYEDALKCHQTMLEIDPKNSVAFLNIGHIYQIYGRYKEAIDNFNKSLELNSAEKRAWYLKGLSLMEQSFVSAISYQLNEALKCFEKAIDVAPNDIGLIKEIAKWLQAKGKADHAHSFYLKAYSLAPDDIDVLTALAETYKNTRKYEAALACCLKLQRVLHDPALNSEIEYIKSVINSNR